MTPRTTALLSLIAFAAGCGKPPAKVPPQEVPPPAVPTTVLTPPPGDFADKVTVKLESDLPATIYLTIDGSDPHGTSPGRISGPSPISVELTKTSILTYFALTDEGGEEPLQAVSYRRAGGPSGTIRGVVVVGPIAVGKEVALIADGTTQSLGTPAAPGELPFFLTGLDSGQHRLVAMSDRNGDGNFWPIIDLSSDVLAVRLDLADPFKASAEDVRIYLGSSQPGLCTIKGTITLPVPAFGQSLSISAMSTDAFSGGADPQALLNGLLGGYQVVTNSTDQDYPYVITDLKPGRYVPVPLLSGFGGGGAAMNFMANPLRSLTLAAGETGIADFRFGPVVLSGTVTLKPTVPPTGVVYGIVAAKNVSFFTGIQGVLMPVVFIPGSTELKGGYAGQALRESSTFQLRVFTSLDAQNPLTAALAWTVNPFAAEPAHATATVGTTAFTKDIIVP
ncbi:MAG: chitobiase/beta-hexosaminidase C-terminal domain-containing protein [Myxococcaceae bacterium]